jgi:hypothetical protein
MKVTDSNTAICCSSYFGPIFCALRYSVGYDAIHTANKSNLSTNSYSHLGENYKHSEYTFESIEAKSFLAVTHEFKVNEIEVYILG